MSNITYQLHSCKVNLFMSFAIIAKNDTELGMCLRMLYPEFKKVEVQPHLNKKKKMEFHIPVDVDDETFARYKNRLETLVN